jgi:hypothetical protein
MRSEMITCDGCGDDISATNNSVDYRLALESDRKRPGGPGACTDMVGYPPVERSHHFCNLPCLDLWRARELHYEAAMRTHLDAWSEHEGYRDESGHIRAFPILPQNTLKEWKAEARQEALEAHPMGQFTIKAAS